MSPGSTKLDELYLPFPWRDDRPVLEPVEPSALPQPYRELLVHTRHMTVTVEEFHGEPVDVKVLMSSRTGDLYARKILLRLQSSGRPVQFAVTRIDLAQLAPAVRDEIVAERTPLGRILIDHGVMRTVRPTGFYRATPPPVLCDWLGLRSPCPLFGRLGVLSVDGRPAIDVAEILAPVA